MTYRAGIIGTGGAAGMGFIGGREAHAERPRASHAGAYTATDGINVVAIADRDRDHLTRFGDLWDVPEPLRYEDHETMLETEALDVVSVCTPTHLHARHVTDVTRLADPEVVWCEKPIAGRLSDAEEAVTACEEANVELVVNHIRRFDPFYAEVIAAIRDGIVGTPEVITALFKRELLRNGTHFADLALATVDEPVTDVGGVLAGDEEVSESDELDVSIDVDDAGGAGTIRLADGTVISLDCTASRESWTALLQVVGDEGKLYVNETDDDCRYWTLRDGVHAPEAPPVTSDEIFDREVAWKRAAEHVTDLAGGETNNRSPGEDAVQVLEVLLGLFVAGYTGSRVEIPLADPLRRVEIRSW